MSIKYVILNLKYIIRKLFFLMYVLVSFLILVLSIYTKFQIMFKVKKFDLGVLININWGCGG